MKRRRSARLILAGGAGVAAVTFHGVFLSGCGSVNPCFGRDGGDLCEPFDSGVKSDAEAGSDAAKDASSDGSSDAASDASGDAASDAPSDAPDAG